MLKWFCQTFISIIISLIPINAMAQTELPSLSKDLLYAVRTEDYSDAEKLIDHLCKVDPKNLQNELTDDKNKLAFWLNIYNAFIQYQLIKNPESFQKRNRFFKRKNICIAGQSFSFDDIEHGILRRSKAKLSLGYWNKLFPSKKEKSLRVDRLDYRIHFALNCGATSCPAIAFYSAENIHQELETAEMVFLTSDSRINHEERIAEVSKIFSWFSADFGEKKGIKTLLLKHQLIPDRQYKIRFKPYNWKMHLEQFRTQHPLYLFSNQYCHKK
jgi:hypothetical protein